MCVIIHQSQIKGDKKWGKIKNEMGNLTKGGGMGFIEDFLHQNKVYPNIKGYDYFIDAVHQAESGEKSMMKIYKNIAKKHNTTPLNVERSIHYLIQTRINGEVIKHHLNNGEVILSLARYKKI